MFPRYGSLGAYNLSIKSRFTFYRQRGKLELKGEK
jgi:hypothetical protein